MVQGSASLPSRVMPTSFSCCTLIAPHVTLLTITPRPGPACAGGYRIGYATSAGVVTLAAAKWGDMLAIPPEVGSGRGGQALLHAFGE